MIKLPKIIELEQRTPEWHAWRAGADIDGPRITATDIPVIMGVSKFSTAYELWMKKTGRAAPQPMNPAMARGVHYEPIARALVERQRGQVYNDCCVEHPDIPWAAASLDGLSALCDEILEIKVPGQEAHALAVLGEVPEGYYPQLQWQLMCCPSVTRALYASFVPAASPADEGTVAIVEVLPDPEYQEKARIAAEAFRQCLIEDIPPCGEEFLAIAAAYDQLREQNLEVEQRLAELESRMKAYVNVVDRQVQGGGITVTQSVRKGTIDLKGYLKSKGFEVDWREAEAFRGPSASSVSLHYRRGVAFPILQRSLGLLPPEAPSSGDGAPASVAPEAPAPALVGPGPVQDQSLEAALLI